MKEFHIDQTQRFSDPLPDMFRFFADPNNLSRLTPDWLHFDIRSPQPIDMKVGTLIDYTIRLRGIPMKWRSEITVWHPPFRFVDEQRIGPYKYWIHEHAFEERGGLTHVSDRVRYAVPGGAVIHRLFVARDIEKIFAYRKNTLADIFTDIDQTSATESI